MSVKQMAAVWELPAEVPPAMRLVLLALADHADDAGVCWPSIPRIATYSGLSERWVQRLVRKAEVAGYLQLQPNRGGIGHPNEYHLTLRKGGSQTTLPSPRKGGSQTTANGGVQEPKGGLQGLKGWSPDHPNHQEPSKEPPPEPPTEVVAVYESLFGPASAAKATYLASIAVRWPAERVIAGLRIEHEAGATPRDICGRLEEGLTKTDRKDRERRDLALIEANGP